MYVGLSYSMYSHCHASYLLIIVLSLIRMLLVKLSTTMSGVTY